MYESLGFERRAPYRDYPPELLERLDRDGAEAGRGPNWTGAAASTPRVASIALLHAGGWAFSQASISSGSIRLSLLVSIFFQSHTWPTVAQVAPPREWDGIAMPCWRPTRNFRSSPAPGRPGDRCFIVGLLCMHIAGGRRLRRPQRAGRRAIQCGRSSGTSRGPADIECKGLFRIRCAEELAPCVLLHRQLHRRRPEGRCAARHADARSRTRRMPAARVRRGWTADSPTGETLMTAVHARIDPVADGRGAIDALGARIRPKAAPAPAGRRGPRRTPPGDDGPASQAAIDACKGKRENDRRHVRRRQGQDADVGLQHGRRRVRGARRRGLGGAGRSSVGGRAAARRSGFSSGMRRRAGRAPLARCSS